MLLANYAIWPLAHLINFRFVPSQQRILYINAVQVIADQLQSDSTVPSLLPSTMHSFQVSCKNDKIQCHFMIF